MDGRELPTLSPDARFVSAAKVADEPHIVIDGPQMPGTTLALSHWPDAETPAWLAADTSAEIVARYLDAEPSGPPVSAITNNHFDEDGLFGAWLALEQPSRHAPERALAIDAATAGDFGVWTDPWAARIALATMAMAEPATTPFPAVHRALRRGSTEDPAAATYNAALPHTGRLLRDPARFERLWRPRWDPIARDISLIEAGAAEITEISELDLAVVRGPRRLWPMAVHPRTDRSRILQATKDGVMVLTYRYETWVTYPSRDLPERVDLAPVAARLQRLERNEGTWRFEGVSPAMPRLFFAGDRGRPGPSSIALGKFIELLQEAFGTEDGRPATLADRGR